MGLNGKVHSRIVILSCCARAANFFSMGTEGEEAAIDVGHSRDEAASSASSASVNLILEEMRKMQEELLRVRRGQEEAAERSERNARKESYSFRIKGNELQFKFNDKVVDKVAAAAAAIGKVDTTSSSSKALLDRAAKELQEGTALLVHRQKVIKLADRSEAGWAVVEEYEGDDLANDSDDERRMEKEGWRKPRGRQKRSWQRKER